MPLTFSARFIRIKVEVFCLVAYCFVKLEFIKMKKLGDFLDERFFKLSENNVRNTSFSTKNSSNYLKIMFETLLKSLLQLFTIITLYTFAKRFIFIK